MMGGGKEWRGDPYRDRLSTRSRPRFGASPKDRRTSEVEAEPPIKLYDPRRLHPSNSRPSCRAWVGARRTAASGGGGLDRGLGGEAEGVRVGGATAQAVRGRARSHPRAGDRAEAEDQSQPRSEREVGAMTTRDEEQRTIAQTRDFLFFLLHCKPGEIKFIRTESHRLLKHYPIMPLLRAGDRMRKCNGGKRTK